MAKKHPDQVAFETMGAIWAESEGRLLKRIAALEQERDGYKDARDKWYVLAHADEVNRLREAIREAIVEIDEARDYVEGTDIARSTLARALTETKKESD